MNTETKYYNAKPSELSNLGIDLGGAKRHNFDTYENPEIKKARQAHNKSVKALKEALKTEVLRENPNPLLVAKYLKETFLAEHNLDINLSLDDVRLIIIERQANTSYLDAEYKTVEKLRTAYNKIRKVTKYLSLDHYASYELRTLKKRYGAKDAFREMNGRTVDWKSFKTEKEVDINHLSKTTKAVQFGNSVPDAERAYILNEMLTFLDYWKSSIPQVDLFPVGWSFGARGNAFSVAFYQHSGNIISVNRNNIGSIIHEIGHFLDYRANLVSREIPSSVVKAYREKVESNGYIGAHLRYLMDRKEIFARAFEAYAYKHFSFSEFVLVGPSMDWPVLCPELEQIIEKALNHIV